MKRTTLLCLCIAGFSALTGCAGAESAAPETVVTDTAEPESSDGISAEEPAVSRNLDDLVQDGDGKYSCTFEGVKHDFIVDLPEQPAGAPCVIMLHGYGESAGGFRSAVRFEAQANPAGYAVVYVTGAANPNDKTSAAGWNSGISSDGNDDVSFLVTFANYLQTEYGFDPDRMFAAGFSNGAFMMHRLAMEASDTFAACVSVAGRMPESIWDARREFNAVGFFQITGEKDDVVPKNSDGSAKYSPAPAIEDVMAYWAESDGLTLSETADTGKSGLLKKYTGDGKSVQVWDLFIKNGRHSWPDKDLTGIDTNQLILDFFEAQK